MIEVDLNEMDHYVCVLISQRKFTCYKWIKGSTRSLMVAKFKLPVVIL